MVHISLSFADNFEKHNRFVMAWWSENWTHPLQHKNGSRVEDKWKLFEIN